LALAMHLPPGAPTRTTDNHSLTTQAISLQSSAFGH
jgi:hypothetical protein